MSSNDAYYDVPYKFADGDTISPYQVNENAREIMRQFRRLEARRYNNFVLHFDLKQLENGDDASEGQVQIRLDFPFEIIGAELHTYGGDDAPGSASGTETITATSTDITNWPELSTTADYDNAGTRSSDKKAFRARCAVGSTYTVDVTIPTTSNAEVTAQLVLHCRYDILSSNDSAYTVPEPPYVKAGDTYSATAWNTWFSEMATAISALSTRLDERRTAEVVNIARNLVTSSVVPINGAGSYALAGSSGTDTVYDAVVFSLCTANTVFYYFHETSNAWSSSLAMSNESVVGGGVTTWVEDNSTWNVTDTPGYSGFDVEARRVQILVNTSLTCKSLYAIVTKKG